MVLMVQKIQVEVVEALGGVEVLVATVGVVL
jgi:hypothetical protein